MSNTQCEYTVWKRLSNQLGQMLEMWTFITISTVRPPVVSCGNPIQYLPVTVSICVHVVIRTENFLQLTRACIANGVFVIIYIVNKQHVDQCQVHRLLFEIDIYRGAFCTDRECLTMQSVTVLLSILAIVSGETEYQPRRWVTKILHDTLENYVPDGGPTCRRDGQAYLEGLKDLRLWATQSEFTSRRQYNIIVIYICLIYHGYII